MIFELIITPFFWILLNKGIPRKDWALGRFGEAIDHLVPFLCLITECLFCNHLVFVRRHFPLIFMIAMVYLSINFWYTKNYKPVYPVVTWKGFMGFLIPFGTVVLAGSLFITLEILTKKRIRNNRHQKVVAILNGNKE